MGRGDGLARCEIVFLMEAYWTIAVVDGEPQGITGPHETLEAAHESVQKLGALIGQVLGTQIEAVRKPRGEA